MNGTRLFYALTGDGPPLAERRQVMVNNAPTFLDEMQDPGAWTADLAALAAIPCPILLTTGDQSFPFWSPVVAKLAAVLPHAQTRVIAGAGHVPQASHPEEYGAAVTAFAGAETIRPG